MARVHIYHFLVNEVGEPIDGADISIFLAGTDAPANLYTDEFNYDFSSTAPQLTTLSNGYFEFWIADEDDIRGYRHSQKFKILWEKTGISRGEIDYIDIFPAVKDIESVNETDEFSIVKDKTVSNKLAYDWQSHINHNILLDTISLPIHGIDIVDLDQVDTTGNKLITNQIGWLWEQHRLSTTASYHPSAGLPHGIDEVDETSLTTNKNKLVSNELMYYLQDSIDTNLAHSDDRDDTLQSNITSGDETLQNNLTAGDVVLQYNITAGDEDLQSNIDDLSNTIGLMVSDIFPITTGDWSDNNDGTYSYTITHDFGVNYPMVTVWNTSTKVVENMASIDEVDVNNTKITSSEVLNLSVRITN
jgi:hypothetical protein